MQPYYTKWPTINPQRYLLSEMEMDTEAQLFSSGKSLHFAPEF